MIVISDLQLPGFLAVLQSKLEDSEEEVRVRACATLSELKDWDAVPSLAKRLRLDSSSRVRREAAYALAEFGPLPHVVQTLADGQKDADASVRYVSKEMLDWVTKPEG